MHTRTHTHLHCLNRIVSGELNELARWRHALAAHVRFGHRLLESEVIFRNEFFRLFFERIRREEEEEEGERERKKRRLSFV